MKNRLADRMLARVAIVFLMVCSCGCGDSPQSIRDHEGLFGGPVGISTVRNATSVMAFRLPPASTPHDSLDEYEMIAGPIEVPDATASDLKDLILSPSVYGWEYVKACGEPEYGVRFQFQHMEEDVDVLVCFKCDHVGVYRNGLWVSGEDCDDARDDLLGIVKPLFPNDPSIQSLE